MLIKECKLSIDELNNAQYIGSLEVGEDIVSSDAFMAYEVVLYNDKLVYGSSCNVGLLAHGYMKCDEFLSLDENLQLLHELLLDDFLLELKEKNSER